MRDKQGKKIGSPRYSIFYCVADLTLTSVLAVVLFIQGTICLGLWVRALFRTYSARAHPL